MANKWDYVKGMGGGAILLLIAFSTLYMTDYREILDTYPDKNLILIDYDGANKLEFLARTTNPEIEFIRWKFEDQRLKTYFGSNLVADSYYNLRCYYDLNGKKGYRNIVQKDIYNITYEEKTKCIEGREVAVNGEFISTEHCTPYEAVVVTQEIDYYFDSRHTNYLGKFTKETELYPTIGKESISFSPNNKEMPCQLVWRNDYIDERESITYKAASQKMEDSIYSKKFDNQLVLDWSDAKEQVSWARQYSTGRLDVAFNSVRGDQFIDPTISAFQEVPSGQIINISTGGTTILHTSLPSSANVSSATMNLYGAIGDESTYPQSPYLTFTNYENGDVYQEYGNETWFKTTTGYPGYYQVNYTKVDGATNNSFWEVKHGCDGNTGAQVHENITLPASCWDADQDKLILRMWSSYGSSGSECYNGTGYMSIGTDFSNSGTTEAGASGSQGNIVDGNWGTGAMFHSGLAWRYFSSCPKTPSQGSGALYEEAIHWDAPIPIESYLWVISGEYRDNTAELAWFNDSDTVGDTAITFTGNENQTKYLDIPSEKLSIPNAISSIEGISSPFEWTEQSTYTDGYSTTTVPAPAIGYNILGEGNWISIVGRYDGFFDGYTWNGTGWDSNSAVVTGLPDITWEADPNFVYDFNGDGGWTLFSGINSCNKLYAWKWNGTSWVENSTYESGWTDLGGNCRVALGYNITGMHDNWEMMVGYNYNDAYTGFYWNGATWTEDSSMAAGISTGSFYPDVAVAKNLDGQDNWNLMRCHYSADEGYTWNGSQWNVQSDLNDGLTTYLGRHACYFVYDFYNTGTWTMVEGQGPHTGTGEFYAWTSSFGYPENPWIEVGNEDGTREWAWVTNETASGTITSPPENVTISIPANAVNLTFATAEINGTNSSGFPTNLTIDTGNDGTIDYECIGTIQGPDCIVDASFNGSGEGEIEFASDVIKTLKLWPTMPALYLATIFLEDASAPPTLGNQTQFDGVSEGEINPTSEILNASLPIYTVNSAVIDLAGNSYTSPSINQFNDSTTIDNITYTGAGSELRYAELSQRTVNTATIDLTGFSVEEVLPGDLEKWAMARFDTHNQFSYNEYPDTAFTGFYMNATHIISVKGGSGAKYWTRPRSSGKLTAPTQYSFTPSGIEFEGDDIHYQNGFWWITSENGELWRFWTNGTKESEVVNSNCMQVTGDGDGKIFCTHDNCENSNALKVFDDDTKALLSQHNLSNCGVLTFENSDGIAVMSDYLYIGGHGTPTYPDLSLIRVYNISDLDVDPLPNTYNYTSDLGYYGFDNCLWCNASSDGPDGYLYYINPGDPSVGAQNFFISSMIVPVENHTEALVIENRSSLHGFWNSSDYWSDCGGGFKSNLVNTYPVTGDGFNRTTVWVYISDHAEDVSIVLEPTSGGTTCGGGAAHKEWNAGDLQDGWNFLEANWSGHASWTGCSGGINYLTFTINTQSPTCEGGSPGRDIDFYFDYMQTMSSYPSHMLWYTNETERYSSTSGKTLWTDMNFRSWDIYEAPSSYHTVPSGSGGGTIDVWPTNVTIDVGNDGTFEYQNLSTFNGSVNDINLTAAAFNNYFTGSHATTPEQSIDTTATSPGNVAFLSGVKKIAGKYTGFTGGITKLGFLLRSIGTAPAGDLNFVVRNVSNDAILGEKVWGDASTTGTSWVVREVTLDYPVIITTPTDIYLSVEYANAPSGYPNVQVGQDDGSNTFAGYTYSTGPWTSTGNYIGINLTNATLTDNCPSFPCDVPIGFSSDSAGTLRYSDINIGGYPTVYPNIEIDVGNDGTAEYTNTSFDGTVNDLDLTAAAFNNYLTGGSNSTEYFTGSPYSSSNLVSPGNAIDGNLNNYPTPDCTSCSAYMYINFTGPVVGDSWVTRKALALGGGTINIHCWGNDDWQYIDAYSTGSINTATFAMPSSCEATTVQFRVKVDVISDSRVRIYELYFNPYLKGNCVSDPCDVPVNFSNSVSGTSLNWSGLNISYGSAGGSVTGFTIDTGDDGSIDYTNASFDGSATVDLNVTAIEDWMVSNCAGSNWCYLPIKFHSDTAGKLDYSAISLKNNVGAGTIDLNSTAVNDWLSANCATGYCDVPILFDFTNGQLSYDIEIGSGTFDVASDASNFSAEILDYMAEINETVHDDTEDAAAYSGPGLTNPTNGYDEDWSTYAFVWNNFANTYIYENYSYVSAFDNGVDLVWKALSDGANFQIYAHCWNYTSSTWDQIRYFNGPGTQTFTDPIPSTCVSAGNPIQQRISMASYSDQGACNYYESNITYSDFNPACPLDERGFCAVPIKVHSDSAGSLNFTGLNVTYTMPEAVDDFSSEINTYLETCDLPNTELDTTLTQRLNASVSGGTWIGISRDDTYTYIGQYATVDTLFRFNESTGEYIDTPTITIHDPADYDIRGNWYSLNSYSSSNKMLAVVSVEELSNPYNIVRVIGDLNTDTLNITRHFKVLAGNDHFWAVAYDGENIWASGSIDSTQYIWRINSTDAETSFTNGVMTYTDQWTKASILGSDLFLTGMAYNPTTDLLYLNTGGSDNTLRAMDRETQALVENFTYTASNDLYDIYMDTSDDQIWFSRYPSNAYTMDFDDGPNCTVPFMFGVGASPAQGGGLNYTLDIEYEAGSPNTSVSYGCGLTKAQFRITSLTQQDLEPEGQTASCPIFNITNIGDGNGGEIKVRLGGSLPAGISMECDESDSFPSPTNLTDSQQTYYTGAVNAGESQGAWCRIDLDNPTSGQMGNIYFEII